MPGGLTLGLVIHLDCRVLCAKVVGVTSSDGFLVHNFTARRICNAYAYCGICCGNVSVLPSVCRADILHWLKPSSGKRHWIVECRSVLRTEQEQISSWIALPRALNGSALGWQTIWSRSRSRFYFLRAAQYHRKGWNLSPASFACADNFRVLNCCNSTVSKKMETICSRLQTMKP